MTDTNAAAPAPAVESDLRLVAALTYGLFLFAICNGFTAIVGVIIAYVKRDDARGTIYESHFTNAIRVFWASVAFVLVATILVIGGVIGLVSFLHMNFGEWHIAHHINAVLNGDQWPLLALLPIAHLVALGFGIWFFYRIVRGLVRVLDNKPY